MKNLLTLLAILLTLTVSAQKGKKQSTATTVVTAPTTTTIVEPSYYSITDVDLNATHIVNDFGTYYEAAVYCTPIGAKTYQVLQRKCTNCTVALTSGIPNSGEIQIGTEVYMRKTNNTNTLITSSLVSMYKIVFQKTTEINADGSIKRDSTGKIIYVKDPIYYRIAYGYGDGRGYLSKEYQYQP